MKKLAKRDNTASSKKPEHIRELETRRTNKDVHITECPAISKSQRPSSDLRKSPSISSMLSKTRMWNGLNNFRIKILIEIYCNKILYERFIDSNWTGKIKIESNLI